MGYQEEEIFCKEVLILPSLLETAKNFSLFVYCFSDFEARLTNLVFTPLLILWRAAPPEQCATCVCCLFFSNPQLAPQVKCCSTLQSVLPSATTDHFIYSIKCLTVSVLLRGHRCPISFCSQLTFAQLHTTHLILPLGPFHCLCLFHQSSFSLSY